MKLNLGGSVHFGAPCRGSDYPTAASQAPAVLPLLAVPMFPKGRSQLNAVAECLVKGGGAMSVEGIVLARAPWRPRPPT